MQIGDRFERLVVIGLIPDRKNPKAICLCDCGSTVTPQRGALRNGSAKSCGCLRREILATVWERKEKLTTEERVARANKRHYEWRKKNPEKRKEIVKKSDEKNRERRALYRANNRARKSLYDKIYVANNRQRRAQARRLNDHKRRIREVASKGSVSKNIASKLLLLQCCKCAICKCDISKKYEIDHINPLAKGGLHDDSNFQLLCQFCNRSKGAKDPIDYMQSKGFLL